MSDFPYLLVTEWYLRLTMGLAIILRRRAPSAALTWLVVVALIPIVGAGGCTSVLPCRPIRRLACPTATVTSFSPLCRPVRVGRTPRRSRGSRDPAGW